MNIAPLFICRLLQREPVSPWKELIDSLENNPFDWVANSCTVDNKTIKLDFGSEMDTRILKFIREILKSRFRVKIQSLQGCKRGTSS